MTREEAIAILEDEAYMLYEDDSPYNRQAFDMAVEALRFRGAYEIAVKAANKAFENRWTQWVEWIPCSERLPDDGEEYLVTVQCDGHSIVDIDQCFSYGWDDYGADVIAWMPLPKPYQEDKQ